MSRSKVNIIAPCWFGLAVLLSLVLPAMAQQTIQFSKPVEKDQSGKANAFMESQHHASVNAFNAPSSLFDSGSSSSFDILSGSPPPTVSREAAARWQKILDKRNNWTLMTPEEIMGVLTPEKILGITDPNDDPRMTPEERYLRRRDRESQMEASNSVTRVDGMLWQGDKLSDSLFKSADDQLKVDGKSQSSQVGPGRSFEGLFGKIPDARDGTDPALDSAWTSPFNSPPPLPKATPEQLAGMERFRALLTPPDPEKTPQANNPFATSLAPAPVPYFQSSPFVNSVGQGPVSLQTTFSKPVGLTMPTASAPPPPPPKPAPIVQQPPWMQSSLQNGILPQRQF